MGRGSDKHRPPWREHSSSQFWQGAYKVWESPRSKAKAKARSKGGSKAFPSYDTDWKADAPLVEIADVSKPRPPMEDLRSKDAQHAVNLLRKAEARVSRVSREQMEKSRRWAAYEKEIRIAFSQEKARHFENMERLQSEMVEAQQQQEAARVNLGKLASSLGTSKEDFADTSDARAQQDWDMLTGVMEAPASREDFSTRTLDLIRREPWLQPRLTEPGDPFAAPGSGGADGSVPQTMSAPTEAEKEVLRRFLGEMGTARVQQHLGAPPGLAAPRPAPVCRDAANEGYDAYPPCRSISATSCAAVRCSPGGHRARVCRFVSQCWTTSYRALPTGLTYSKSAREARRGSGAPSGAESGRWRPCGCSGIKRGDQGGGDAPLFQCGQWALSQSKAGSEESAAQRDSLEAFWRAWSSCDYSAEHYGYRRSYGAVTPCQLCRGRQRPGYAVGASLPGLPVTWLTEEIRRQISGEPVCFTNWEGRLGLPSHVAETSSGGRDDLRLTGDQCLSGSEVHLVEPRLLRFLCVWPSACTVSTPSCSLFFPVVPLASSDEYFVGNLFSMLPSASCHAPWALECGLGGSGLHVAPPWLSQDEPCLHFFRSNRAFDFGCDFHGPDFTSLPRSGFGTWLSSSLAVFVCFGLGLYWRFGPVCQKDVETFRYFWWCLMARFRGPCGMHGDSSAQASPGFGRSMAFVSCTCLFLRLLTEAQAGSRVCLEMQVLGLLRVLSLVGSLVLGFGVLCRVAIACFRGHRKSSLPWGVVTSALIVGLGSATHVSAGPLPWQRETPVRHKKLGRTARWCRGLAMRLFLWTFSHVLGSLPVGFGNGLVGAGFFVPWCFVPGAFASQFDFDQTSEPDALLPEELPVSVNPDLQEVEITSHGLSLRGNLWIADNEWVPQEAVADPQVRAVPADIGWPLAADRPSRHTYKSAKSDAVRIPLDSAGELLVSEGKWIGVVLMAVHYQAQTWAFRFDEAADQNSLMETVLSLGDDLFDEGLDSVFPVCPQRFPGYAMFVVFPRIIGLVPNNDRVAAIVDASSVGGHYFAAYMPPEVEHAELIRFVRPQTHSDVEQFWIYVGRCRTPFTHGSMLHVGHGEVVTVVRPGEEPPASTTLPQVLSRPAEFGRIEQTPRERHLPAFCFMCSGDRYALYERHHSGLSPHEAVAQVLEVNKADVSICSAEGFADLDLHGDPCGTCLGAVALPPDSAGVRRDFYTFLDSRPLGHRPHFHFSHNSCLHIPTLLNLYRISLPPGFGLTVEGGRVSRDEVFVQCVTTLSFRAFPLDERSTRSSPMPAAESGSSSGGNGNDAVDRGDSSSGAACNEGSNTEGQGGKDRSRSPKGKRSQSEQAVEHVNVGLRAGLRAVAKLVEWSPPRLDIVLSSFPSISAPSFPVCIFRLDDPPDLAVVRGNETVVSHEQHLRMLFLPFGDGVVGGAAPADVVMQPPEESSDESTERPILPAMFVIVTPDYTHDSVVVPLREGCSVDFALAELEDVREPARRVRFPCLVPAHPQLDCPYGVLLGLPSWMSDEIVVVVDDRAIHGTVYAACIHDHPTREELLVMAGYDADSTTDVCVGVMNQAVQPGVPYSLALGDSVGFVPAGEVYSVGLPLEDMLNSAPLWNSEAPVPFQPGPALCILHDTGGVRFPIDAERQEHIRSDVADALQYDVDRLTLRAAFPRAIDHSSRGWYNRAVVVATQSVQRPPNRPRPCKFVVFDLRPVLAGLRWEVYLFESLPLALLVDRFSQLGPPGFTVKISGAQQIWEQGELVVLLDDCQLLVVDIEAPPPDEQSDDQDESSDGSDPAPEDPGVDSYFIPPRDTSHERSRSRSPRPNHGPRRHSDTSSEPVDFEPETAGLQHVRQCALAHGSDRQTVFGSLRMSPAFMWSKHFLQDALAEGNAGITSVGTGDCLSGHVSKDVPSDLVSCLSGAEDIGLRLLHEPKGAGPESQSQLDSLRFVTVELGGEWPYFDIGGQRVHGVLRDAEVPETAAADVIQRLVVLILKVQFTPEVLAVELPIPSVVQEFLGVTRAARNVADEHAFPHLIEASPQPIAGVCVLLAGPAWLGTAVIACIDLTEVDGRVFSLRLPDYINRQNALMFADLPPSSDYWVFVGDSLEPMPEGVPTHLFPGVAIRFVMPGADPAEKDDLGQMLLQGEGWRADWDAAGPITPGCYCLALRYGCRVFFADDVSPWNYRRRLAESIASTPQCTRIFPAEPRAMNTEIDGYKCRTVLAVVPSSFMLEVGACRRLLQGWMCFRATEHSILADSVLDMLNEEAPPGWTAEVDGVSVGYLRLEVAPGSVLVATYILRPEARGHNPIADADWGANAWVTQQGSEAASAVDAGQVFRAWALYLVPDTLLVKSSWNWPSLQLWNRSVGRLRLTVTLPRPFMIPSCLLLTRNRILRLQPLSCARNGPGRTVLS